MSRVSQEWQVYFSCFRRRDESGGMEGFTKAKSKIDAAVSAILKEHSFGCKKQLHRLIWLGGLFPQGAPT